MKWVEAKIIFNHPDEDLAVDLLSDMFYDFGLQGVVVGDPRIEPEGGWPEDVVGRPEQFTITGYFPDDGRLEKQCKVLEEKLVNLKQRLGLICRLSYKEIDEEDWAHSWKVYFKPLKIGRNMAVKPTWRDYRPAPGEKVIELDPGMAFGTGTHPTTTMCLTMMEKYLKDQDLFLDVGTGSGILLIAAAKLGAFKVWGVDNDPTAVKIAAGNLKLNDVNVQDGHIICGDLVQGIRQKHDIITANILSHVIVDLLKDIRQVLKPGGILICSGIVDTSKKQVVASMKKINFEIIEMCSKDEWVAIAGRLKV